MNTTKIQKNETKMVAHRGVSGIERENTAAAFIAAGNRSYFGIETDVHRTADGRFVVVHDSDLKRVAGEDVNVEKVSLAVCQNVVLCDKEGGKSRADLRTPSLEEYASICNKYEKCSVLELKSYFTKQEIADITDILKSLGQLENTIFISFVFDNLVFLRELLPDQPVQFLTDCYSEELLERLVDHKMDWDVRYDILTEELVKKMHANGIKVNCWTVDDKAVAEKLADWGVDFITSDICE